VALHQQNHAGQCTCIAPQTFEVDFSAQDRLDALASAFFVELDATEQVIQIGDGQGRLPVFGGHFDHIVDAASGVNDREFRVEAQVGKHGPIVEGWGPSNCQI